VSAHPSHPGIDSLVHVCSITVAFNPDPARLAEQIAALRGQVDEILIVDNHSEPPAETVLRRSGEFPPHERTRLRFVRLDDNRGVAAAFNLGAREAASAGAQFVLLLDHDSVPAPDMVSKLLGAYRHCSELPGAQPVAAVGPRVNDRRNAREYPFIRLGWLYNPRLRCGASESVVPCDFLISSGSLIALDALAHVGEFDESLFIDSVDLEWCSRARARGFALYGACAARLDHRLGDRHHVVMKGIRLVVHSPRRVYYMTRNRLLLYRRPYMPLKWKLKDALRAAAKFVATVLLVPPRLEYAKMTLRAIRDAAARRGGSLDGKA
jgi:rhamnosyltransferase